MNNIEKARKFLKEVRELANEYELNFFIVTDGASAISNNGNEAVKAARDHQIMWEKEHGFGPDEDWG